MKWVSLACLLFTALPGLAEAQSHIQLPLAASGGDNAQIMAALNNIQAQIGALRQQVDQQGQDIKAMQIVLTLTANNADKAKAEASNNGATLSALEANVNGLTASVAAEKSSLSAIQSLETSIEGRTSAIQPLAASVNSIGALQTDMARRLYMTCIMGAISASAGFPGSSAPYTNASCTSAGWDTSGPQAWKFDTPFGH